MDRNSKLYRNMNIRNVIYSEVGIGISANTFLVVFHVFVFVLEYRPKVTDLPIGLLALIHLLMLVNMWFITTSIFLSWGKWDDITCKFLIFFLRFFRGLSLCATSLLSVLQAVTLSPNSSCLAKFKHKSSYHFLCSLLFLNVFYTISSSHLLTYVIANNNLTYNVTSHNLTYLTKSCSLLPMSFSIQHTFSALLTVRDIILIGLMVLSSVYMVILLLKHKRRFQHLHATRLSPKASPEQRATRTILLLMSFFVVMAAFDSFLSYLRTMNDDPVLYCVHILVAHSYATISPLVVLSTEKRIKNILRSMFERPGNI